ncbi:MAG: tryptophan--tRNA ligase [Thermoplasmata archaeon]|nr:tryptophan--tRNA ligase [Thermoplasmata archaeon]MVT14717.1 tryptophan--tRNA ligase [Euryarchaeota archaeon]MVT35957.1 tryptophan--tRNA ligase [Euryarchaeota archaeon]
MVKKETTKITPWEVEGKVDYDKLIRKFGTSPLDQELVKRIERNAGASHLFLRRGIFFSHRDLNLVMDDYENGKGFFLYTGRGPSGPMHIGHIIPFIMTKWFQERFKVNVYIELTDDEKFLNDEKITLDYSRKWSYENALDIIALGFDPDKTFIFQDTDYIKNIYPMAIKVAKKINFSLVKAVFGFRNDTNIGMIFYPAIQIVPTFFEKKRCLIPAAIDQDPYWRIQRDIAEGFGYYKAAAIHNRFLPPLTGLEGKMSASIPETAIYLHDDEKTVRQKIMKYAFSGGQATVELHRKLGGNPDVDVSFQWLKYLFEPDDSKIKKIEEEYRSGNLLTGELKEILIEKINQFLEKHRSEREKAKEKINEFTQNGILAQQMRNNIFE